MWVKKSALQAEGPMQGSSGTAEAHMPRWAHDYRARVSSKVISILRQANNWWECMLYEQVPSIEKWQGSQI